MTDIMLDKAGDIKVSAVGDISLTESVRQAVLIRLRWIYQEWRLGPTMGFPWFEEVFVKNPNTVKIRQLIRDEIMQVEGVTASPATELAFANRPGMHMAFVMSKLRSVLVSWPYIQ